MSQNRGCKYKSLKLRNLIVEALQRNFSSLKESAGCWDSGVQGGDN